MIDLLLSGVLDQLLGLGVLVIVTDDLGLRRRWWSVGKYLSRTVHGWYIWLVLLFDQPLRMLNFWDRGVLSR